MGRHVGAKALYEALGWSASAFYRALAAGRVPPAAKHTPGGHGRWTVDVAAAFVRNAGGDVPEEWTRAAA